MTLGEYLLAVVAKPFGVDGCCTFVADWCVELGHPDPMAFIRGSYASAEEVAALLQKPGLLRLAHRGFESIGLPQTLEPATGDVGVIHRLTDDHVDIVCAIRSGERWVSRLDRGLLVAEAPTIRAWRTAP